jgi:putative DNA primase/helicase
VSAIDRVIAALDARDLRPRRNGGGWTALCPAHGDGEPSLSVGEGHDGRALVHCYAGCATADVLDGLNLEVTDLFVGERKPWTNAGLRRTGASFDRDGRVLLGGTRYLPGAPDGEIKALAAKGSERDLWPDPATITGPLLFVVEGEPDAVTGATLELPTVAVPGAGKWRPEWATTLAAGRDRVVVIADSDERGRAAAQRAAAAIAGHCADVRVLDLAPDSSDGRDLSDYAAAAGDDGERRQCAALLLRAGELAPRVQPNDIQARGAGAVPSTAAPTDIGNGELFAEEHAARLRYVAEQHRWIVWRDGRWCPDALGEHERAAKTTAQRLLTCAAAIEDTDQRSRAAKWAAISQSEPRLRAMLSLARWEPDVVVSAAHLDAHPLLLACANGTIDLTTGALCPSRPADLITRGTNVAYDPDATCPRWERFLMEVFAGDLELVAFVQRLIGYCCTGDTREHILAVLHGGGCNGKTTLVEVLKLLLGDLAVTAAFDTFARTRGDRGPRNDLARLHGARLVTASESGEGRRLDEATVKEITGGDTIAARFLYGEHFEYRPAFKILLSTNHRPAVDGDDDAIWRRLRLIPFEQTFEGREDRHLSAKLRAELPGILAWAIRGCLDWQRDGLGEAGAVQQATHAYRADEDTIGTFLADCCSEGAGRAETAAVRAAYASWCERNGERPVSSKALTQMLTRRPGIEAKRNGRGRYFTGIELVSDDGSEHRNGNSPHARAYRGVTDSAVTTCHPSPDEAMR